MVGRKRGSSRVKKSRFMYKKAVFYMDKGEFRWGREDSGGGETEEW